MTRPMSEASDAVLAIATAKGERLALAEIYRRHGGPVFRLAQRLLNDDKAAEDVVQDVFVRFWQEPERFDPERGELRSFLLMKSHSKSVDVIRSETSRRRRDQLDANDFSRASYDVEREVLDLELAHRVNAALSNLPEPERKAITLAFFGGHSYREVANMLSEPEGTVKSRIRNGLKVLRRNLTDHDHETSGHESARKPMLFGGTS
jgi:RNA polymerase sigma-70 factor, ECF subfamily